MRGVVRKRIGDFAEKVGSGATPKGGEAAYKSSGIPLIRSMNVHFDGFRTEGLAFLDEVQAKALKNVEVRKDDVLLNITGASIGRVTLAPPDVEGGRVNQHVCIVRPDESVNSSYLRWFLASPLMQRQIDSMESGATRQALTKEKILGFEVPVPSLDEQRRVVAEIDKQFSRLDEAVANLQRVKANLKRYKAAVLKAAVEGRLVETEASIARREGRSYETGEQLLQRLLEVRRARPKGKSKYKEPATPNLGAVTALPEGWTCASVEQVVAHLTDGDHQAPPQTDSGVPFLVIGNVRTGEIDLSDTRFVGEDYYNTLDSYRQPAQGDLLYTLVGSYGIPVRVKTAERFCIQRHMAILRPHSESPMDYLTIAMASDSVFKQATEVSTGTAQMTVPLSGLRSIAIGLPPKTEQVRIVAEVDRRLSIIREVEFGIDAASQRAKALRHATLSKAFS